MHQDPISERLARLFPEKPQNYLPVEVDDAVLRFWDWVCESADLPIEERVPLVRAWAQALGEAIVGMMGEAEGVDAPALSRMYFNDQIHIKWVTNKKGQRIPVHDWMAGDKTKPQIIQPAQPQQTIPVAEAPLSGPRKGTVGGSALTWPQQVRQRILKGERLTGVEVAQIVREFMEKTHPIEEQLRQAVETEMAKVRKEGEGTAPALVKALARLSRFQMERTEHIKTILNVQEPVNLSAAFTSGVSDAVQARVGKAIEQFSKMAQRQAARGSTVYFRSTTGDRTFYQKGAIHISEQDCRVGTLIHYLGHWLEQADEDLRRNSQAFYNNRTAKDQPQPLGKGFAPTEMTKKDSFMDPYMGKVMADGTEIVPMGLEFFYRDPGRLAVEDPQYFTFVYEAVRDRPENLGYPHPKEGSPPPPHTP